MNEIMNLSKFKKILYRPMTRREFLGYIGVMLLSIIGLAGVLKNLGELDHKIPFYSNGSYGGKKKGGV